MGLVIRTVVPTMMSGCCFNGFVARRLVPVYIPLLLSVRVGLVTVDQLIFVLGFSPC